MSGLSCLAKGQSGNRIVALVQNLGLAMPVPSDVPFVQCNTAICETCKRARNSILLRLNRSESTEGGKDHLRHLSEVTLFLLLPNFSSGYHEDQDSLTHFQRTKLNAFPSKTLKSQVHQFSRKWSHENSEDELQKQL